MRLLGHNGVREMGDSGRFIWFMTDDGAILTSCLAL